MATSKQLSQIRKGTNLPTLSKEDDRNLFRVVSQVKSTISANFGLRLEHIKQIKHNEIYDFDMKGSQFPDGGALVTRLGDRMLPILCAENKRQGWKPIKDRKSAAMGNAFERLHKQVVMMQSWTVDEDILPFVAFCSGHDFFEGSYIANRLLLATHGLPLNRIHIYKPRSRYGGASIFYQVEPFSDSFMYETCLKVALISVEYYQKKYKLRLAYGD